MKILVVDDEQDICEILKFNLELEGYEVDTANSAEEALEMKVEEYGLFMIDVMMAGLSGFDMARQLRENPATHEVPIIIISAMNDEDHKVKGLNIGADDYITKPLSLREVKARVAAVIRRSSRTPVNKENPIKESLEVGPFRVDLDKKSVFVDGSAVALTRLELEILLLFLKNPGRVYAREEFVDACWPNDSYVMGRTVDVNINRLRKKLGVHGSYIKSRVGFGYVFEI